MQSNYRETRWICLRLSWTSQWCRSTLHSSSRGHGGIVYLFICSLLLFGVYGFQCLIQKLVNLTTASSVPDLAVNDQNNAGNWRELGFTIDV